MKYHYVMNIDFPFGRKERESLFPSPYLSKAYAYAYAYVCDCVYGYVLCFLVFNFCKFELVFTFQAQGLKFFDCYPYVCASTSPFL